MTTITGDVGIGWGVPPAAVGDGPAYVLVRPADLVNTPTGVTMLPWAHRKKLEDDGTFSIEIDPLPSGFAHVFEFVVGGGRWMSAPLSVFVPAAGTYRLADLVPGGGSSVVPPAWYQDVLATRTEVAAARPVVAADAKTASDAAKAAQIAAAAAANLGVLKASDPVPAGWPSRLILREAP